MRPDADAARVRALVRDLARHATQCVRLYLTGGATAVLVGWRTSTVDVDIKLVPEDDGLLHRLPAAKEAVPVNIELASPFDFIPAPAGWEDRSRYAFTEGPIDVYHLDPYSQALAKLQRALTRDLFDVDAMHRRGWIESTRLTELFEEIEPQLYRFPVIDPAAFRARVEAFVDSC
ncbi:MAG: DUF6036 family nucleotidyltransferase [Solirubrobacteraceae bacterium]